MNLINFCFLFPLQTLKTFMHYVKVCFSFYFINLINFMNLKNF